MRRAQIQQPHFPQFHLPLNKSHSNSLSTDQSMSPRDITNQQLIPKSSIRKDKEKSQLCKKFIENGFCPYQKKCKFAHGSHELRKNQQFNSKYKTKECGVLINQGCCMFGERCNFIHKLPLEISRQTKLGFGMQEVRAEGRLQSRLLTLLSLVQSQ